jgi:uncharacterized protein (TIGR00661 family)
MANLKKRARILWGVCGIGNGHTFRQLPLIEHFAKENSIVIFGYNNSHRFFQDYFANHPNITTSKVAVSFYPGNSEGLDFKAMINRPGNTTEQSSINAQAMAHAWDVLRHPDLVVSDYEPVSAQYAYAHDAPLITVDQQSKYLVGDFPTLLNGQTYIDEQMRLRMFFPKANERIACSFFTTPRKPEAKENVTVYPSVLRDQIGYLERNPSTGNKIIIIYVSSQQDFRQSFSEISDICAGFSDVDFHYFTKDVSKTATANVTVHEAGDKQFYDILKKCNGIITTAGHSLLSEAMYLGIPVYALPLPLYEQQMNAHVINANGFGLLSDKLETADLRHFIANLPLYSQTINQDRTVLLREAGQRPIIRQLQKYIR